MSKKDSDRGPAAKQFLGDFLKFMLTASGTAPVAGLFTREAHEARKDQSGVLPVLGVDEGMQALTPSKQFYPAMGKMALEAIPFGAGRALGGLFTPEAEEARQTQDTFLPRAGIIAGLKAFDPLSGYKSIENTTNTGSTTGLSNIPEGTREEEIAMRQAQGAFIPEGMGVPAQAGGGTLGARGDWLADTANSPAARSGAFTDEQRWQQHLENQRWRKEQGRDYSHGMFL